MPVGLVPFVAVYSWAVTGAEAGVALGPVDEAAHQVRSFDCEALDLAIEDLIETSGPDYPEGQAYLVTRIRCSK